MSQKKVFLEIVGQIREIIEQDGLTVGEKIPSERELAARLGVGRSSVREALRSLELLGLIQTRVGGGTYIKDFGEHRLVQLVGTFILLDQQTKKELVETKSLLEKEGIHKACEAQDIHLLQKIVESWDESIPLSSIDSFFRILIQEYTNHLVFRIWSVCNDYFLTMFKEEQYIQKKYFEKLISELNEGNEEKALVTFRVIQTEIVNKIN